MTHRLSVLPGLVLLSLLATWPARGQVPAAPPSIEYYHLDALGSVRAVSDHAGVVIRRHELRPFGEEWTAEGTLPPDEVRLFTGKERDTETGLDYFGARYYRAEIGRFTTIDPVYTWKENLEDPQRWNRYAYVRNNPLRYTDPDGRCIYPGADCAQYLFGAVKGFVNGFSGMATMVNQAANTLLGPFTDFRFGAAPRWEPTNIDQARGEIAFGVTSLFALGQAAATKAVGAAVESGVEAGNGLKTTIHGAERLAGPAATRGGVLNASEVLEVQAQGRAMVQSDGAAVRILDTGGGRFSVVVQGEQGIVTTFKNLSQKSLDKLGRNYGWREPE